jgi:DNA-binding IclR family transcriptional regulator
VAFGEQHRDLTFAELHRLVDMPKATAYRVVQTLEYMGFLERNARTNTFSLGMNVLRLGFEYIASLDVAQVGQPVIEQLRDVSQCSSHLAIRDGRDIITLPASAPPVAYQSGQHWHPSAGALHLAWAHVIDRYFPRRF